MWAWAWFFFSLSLNFRMWMHIKSHFSWCDSFIGRHKVSANHRYREFSKYFHTHNFRNSKLIMHCFSQIRTIHFIHTLRSGRRCFVCSCSHWCACAHVSSNIAHINEHFAPFKSNKSEPSPTTTKLRMRKRKKNHFENENEENEKRKHVSAVAAIEKRDEKEVADFQIAFYVLQHVDLQFR